MIRTMKKYYSIGVFESPRIICDIGPLLTDPCIYLLSPLESP